MEKKRKLPARPTGDTVEIKGVQYNILLRRIPEEGKKNVRNRRTTQSNAPDENTTINKKAKNKKGVTSNHGATPTRTKKIKR